MHYNKLLLTGYSSTCSWNISQVCAIFKHSNFARRIILVFLLKPLLLLPTFQSFIFINRPICCPGRNIFTANNLPAVFLHALDRVHPSKVRISLHIFFSFPVCHPRYVSRFLYYTRAIFRVRVGTKSDSGIRS